MMSNEYTPFLSEILQVKKHTDIEYTFRMSYQGEVRPGQFFEVSLPKYGEAPISVSGIGEDFIELTIRKVGKVTNEIFERYQGDKLFLRGPYGNGFDVNLHRGKELVVIAGGTGVSPVRGVIDYFSMNSLELEGMAVIAGFKNPSQMLFREDFERWEKAMNLIVTVDSDKNHEGDKEDTEDIEDTKRQSPSYRIGLVTDYIPELNVKDKSSAHAIVVGPPAMMHFTVIGLLKEGFLEENIWISHERKMCCGIGKCGHCKIDDTYVCLDGPVFNYVKGRQLID